MLAKLLGLICAITALGAASQEAPWPQQRPIRMLVGTPAGYSPDVVSRLLARELARELTQSVVVENRPGVGGALMMRALRSAAPDGYTIGSVFWSQMSVAPAPIKQIDYDPAEDFTHVGVWTAGPQILVAHPGSGINSVEQLAAKARSANPPLLYASMGVAAPSHIFMALLQERGALRMGHVPFSSQNGVRAVVNGEVPVGMFGVGDALPMIRDGRLVPLAVTGTRRAPALPNVPTLQQAGVPGVTHAVWAGLIMPKGTPPEIVNRLNRALHAVVAHPEFRTRLEETGRTVQVGSPAEMQRLVREEIPFWRDVVVRAGISPE